MAVDFSRLLRLVKASVVLALGWAVCGCAVMSPKECEMANWRNIGLGDGLAGKSLDMLNERTSACAEAGFSADATAYLRGRDQGLLSYCQMDNAVRTGLRGDRYEGVCPPGVDAEFRRRNQMAFEVHRLREEVAQLDRRSEELESRLRRHEHEHEKKWKETSKDDERKRLREELEEEQRRVRRELRDIDRNLRRNRDQLRDAEWLLDRLPR